MEQLKPVVILLVEDDPGDQKLVRLSFQKQQIANEIEIADSAEEALDRLRAEGDYEGDRLCPDLILLDLNMPGMGGKEFLRIVKSDDALKSIPVIVLTTSSSDIDILDSYNLHASGYVNKPVKIEDFIEVVKQIESYWFVVCKTPPNDAHEYKKQAKHREA